MLIKGSKRAQKYISVSSKNTKSFPLSTSSFIQLNKKGKRTTHLINSVMDSVKSDLHLEFGIAIRSTDKGLFLIISSRDLCCSIDLRRNGFISPILTSIVKGKFNFNGKIEI